MNDQSKGLMIPAAGALPLPPGSSLKVTRTPSGMSLAVRTGVEGLPAAARLRGCGGEVERGFIACYDDGSHRDVHWHKSVDEFLEWEMSLDRNLRLEQLCAKGGARAAKRLMGRRCGLLVGSAASQAADSEVVGVVRVGETVAYKAAESTAAAFEFAGGIVAAATKAAAAASAAAASAVRAAKAADGKSARD